MINLSKTTFIFIIILSFIKSEIHWMYYDVEIGYLENEITKAEKKSVYAYDFRDYNKIPYYLKIEVISSDSNPAPLLCFSNIDITCRERLQLVKDPNNKAVVMWIKREEISNPDQELFIIVECLNDGCSYNIRTSSYQEVTFEPNFVYSYLVTSLNKEIVFEIQGMEKIEKNAYLSIILEGSSSVLLNIENVQNNNEIIYNNGRANLIYIDDISEKNILTLRIRGAEDGQYLTLSAHLVDIDENLESSALYDMILPNGPEISGYLEKNIINKECFPIDLSNEKYKGVNQLFITGRVQTKYGLFYLEDESRKTIEESLIEISDGQLSYVMKNNGKLNYICFEIMKNEPFNKDKMVFTFSITDPANLDPLYDYYPPQLTGQIYRRIIPKGHIAFFSGTNIDNTAKKNDYNLYQIKGLTEMYIGDCRNYPDCHYSEEKLKNLIKPKSINQMAIWTTYEDKSSAIGSDKNVIIAYCKDDDNENNGYCIFETSIFNRGQDIYLVENEIFSKFVLKEEKGQFILENIIQNSFIDIMIYNGEVTFDIEDDNINYQKYYLVNKIHYHFTESADKIIIKFNAHLNSFFTIIYRIDYHNSKQLKEIISSGENYLVQISPNSLEKEKTILIPNIRYKNKNPYLINFYSLNCELEVKSPYDEIYFYDGYAQEIKQLSSTSYASNYYEYSIKIKEADLSNNNNKMCMLYVSGYEAEKDNSREIVIGDNINQQIIFENNLKKIRFLYPQANPGRYLALSVKVIDQSYFDINVYVKDTNILSSTITKNKIFSLNGNVISLYCEKDTLCPITIQIEYSMGIIRPDPMVEVNIREILNVPSYLQKNKVKKDFISGNYYYYLYTDIGKNDICEITANFLRDKGSILTKVVRKDQILPEEEANFRGIYRMPSEEWEDSKLFNQYTQKMVINEEDTHDCIEGCYLLITIKGPKLGIYVDDDTFFPFSILARFLPNNKAYLDIPIILIKADEYIIGNIDVAQNERIYEFYEILLPHDSEIVEFDWQSSLAGLYINVGGSKPTSKNADFKLLPSGKNSVLTLSKQEILDKAKNKKIIVPSPYSIQDVNLVIGIWTDKADSVDTELYSLRIHQPENNEENLDIIEVNSEQKMLCKPVKISDDQYRCLFIVVYEGSDVELMTSLLTYASSVNSRSLNYMYASFIDRYIYDESIIRELKSSIPNYETATYNTKTEGIDYIFLKQLERNKYLFINVISDKPDDIILMTSMKIFNYLEYDNNFDIYPKSHGEELLSIKDNKLYLSFSTNNGIMVDIVGIYGQAEIYWDNERDKIFNINGNGDIISLSSGQKQNLLRITRKNENNNNLNTIEDAGFVFYIKYRLRDPEINFDEIIYGKSTQISNKNNDFPISLYSKIGSEYNDINIGVTFKDSLFDESGEINSSSLFISAQLVKERTIYAAKANTDLSPPIENIIIGNYNPALSTIQFFLSEETLKNYNIKAEDNPSLYIRINRDNIIENNLFKTFDIDVEVKGVNDGIIPSENFYHYGKLKDTDLISSIYKLKTDKNRPYMRIQIAFNSDNLNFVISDSENTNVNTTFLKAEKRSGKISITLKRKDNAEIYYLHIYKNEETKNEKYLNNYSFKYINVKNEDDLIEYKILDSSDISYTETIKEKDNTISCVFNKLDIETKEANITYFLKLIDNTTYINDEYYDTIAMTESFHQISYKRNPIDNEGKITLTAKGYLNNWRYLNIIAQVQKGNNIEYISYGGKKNYRDN